MAIAVIIGIGLGMLTYRHRLPSSLATATTSAFLTIPSIALLGILIGPLGLGTPASTAPWWTPGEAWV
jgi:ABC-type proline/glycine betaine transport system permease subunit